MQLEKNRVKHGVESEIAAHRFAMLAMTTKLDPRRCGDLRWALTFCLVEDKVFYFLAGQIKCAISRSGGAA